MKYNGTVYRYYYDTPEKIGIVETPKTSQATHKSENYILTKISSWVNKGSWVEVHYNAEILGKKFSLEFDVFCDLEQQTGFIEELRFTIDNPISTNDTRDLEKLEKLLAKKDLILEPHYYYREDKFLLIKNNQEKIADILKLISKHEKFPGLLTTDLNDFFKKKNCKLKLPKSKIYKAAKAAADSHYKNRIRK